MPDLTPKNKRERSLVSRAKASVRKKVNDEKDDVGDIVKLLVGGYGGQRLMGGTPTPYLEQIPLAYTLAVANVFFGVGGKGTTRMLIIGNAVGEAAVRGRAAGTMNLFGGLFGGGSAQP